MRPLPGAAAAPAVPHGFETRARGTVTADDGPIHRLRSVDLAVPDEEVWRLVPDVGVRGDPTVSRS